MLKTMLTKKEYTSFANLRYISRTNFMHSSVEHEKKFITSALDVHLQNHQILYSEHDKHHVNVQMCRMICICPVLHDLRHSCFVCVIYIRFSEQTTDKPLNTDTRHNDQMLY